VEGKEEVREKKRGGNTEGDRKEVKENVRGGWGE
jgi:hypothetical protein